MGRRRRQKPWTQTELALIEEERQRWMAVGTSTEPTSIDAAQRAVTTLLRRAGKEPGFVWVVPGPLAAQVAMGLWRAHRSTNTPRLLLGGYDLRANLANTLDASVTRGLGYYTPLYSDLADGFQDSVRNGIGNIVDGFRASLHDLNPAKLDTNCIALRHTRVAGVELQNSLIDDFLRHNRIVSDPNLMRRGLRDTFEASLRSSLHHFGTSLNDSLVTDLQDDRPIPDLCPVLLLDNTVGARLRDTFDAILRDSLAGHLRRGLRDTFESGLSASLLHLGTSLDANLRASFGASFDSLSVSLRDSLRGSLRDSLASQCVYQWTWCWGQHDAYWIGWYDCAGKLVKRLYTSEQETRLAEFVALTEAGWWWPFEDGLSVVMGRPTVCRMDSVGSGGQERRRLHCDYGPALAYADGWEVYAWHGVRVPRSVIMTPVTELKAGAVLAEPNAEVRRVLMARMGWERFIREAGMAPIQADDYGRLYDIPIDTTRSYRVVRVVNGTPEPAGADRADCERGHDGQWYKVYWLRCLARHTTAREAVAWSYFLAKPEDYQPAVRT